jgi:putative ABC transport system substrate-binding protein
VKRRDFIAGLGSAAAWPLAARAQQPAIPLIGFLSSQTAGAAAEFVAAFHKGLSETGFIEGRNVGVEYRWANDQPEQLPALAADLVGRHIAIIVAGGGPVSALAAKDASKTIPVLFSSGADPVRLGLVASLNRPGGNITGVNILITAIESKRVGLVQTLMPTAKSIALLINPSSLDAETQLNDVRAAARAIGKEIRVFNARNEAEIDAVFAMLAQAKGEPVQVAADPLFMSRREQIVALAARNGSPAIYEARPFSAAGGLMSYGPNMTDAYRQLGIYAGRILKGEKPADLPVVQPTKLELVINLKTARTLGIEIPPQLLAIADEVIE